MHTLRPLNHLPIPSQTTSWLPPNIDDEEAISVIWLCAANGRRAARNHRVRDAFACMDALDEIVITRNAVFIHSAARNAIAGIQAELIASGAMV